MSPGASVELEVQRLEDLGLNRDARILRASGRAWSASPLMLEAPVLVAGGARVPAVTVSEMAAGPSGPLWSADFRVPETIAAVAERWAVETAPTTPVGPAAPAPLPGHDERPILGGRPHRPTAGTELGQRPGTAGSLRLASARPVLAPPGRPSADRALPLSSRSSTAGGFPEPPVRWTREHAARDEPEPAGASPPPGGTRRPPSSFRAALQALEEVPQTMARLERRVAELAELAGRTRVADARRVVEAEARADAAATRVQRAEVAATSASAARAAAEAALREQAADHATWVAERDERAAAHADALRRLDVALAERDEARARVEVAVAERDEARARVDIAVAERDEARILADAPGEGAPPPPREHGDAPQDPEGLRSVVAPEGAPATRHVAEARHSAVWEEPQGFPHVGLTLLAPPSAPAPAAAPPPPAPTPADPPAQPELDPDEPGAPAEPSAPEAGPPIRPAPAPARSRPARRRLGLGVGVLAGAGVLLTADAITTAVWQEPLSAAYTAREQSSLRQEERTLSRTFGRDARAPGAGQPAGSRLAQLAAALRSEVEPGDAIGRLRIPRVDGSWVVVQGSEPRQLRAGPGHPVGSALPGMAASTSVVGRAATFGAPFRQLDELRPGDELEMQMPYGAFTYRVERSQTMSREDAAGLESGSGEARLVLTAPASRLGGDELRVVSARQVDATPRGPAA